MYSRSGLFKVSDLKTPRERKIKDFLITFGLCLLAMAIVFSFIFFAKIPSFKLFESRDIYGEKSDPTLARLILFFVDIVIIIITLILSNKFDKEYKLFTSTFFAYLAGTFLWQAIGECIWHYGFFRIEAAPAIPIAILFTILFMYCYRRDCLSWPVLILIVAFMSNWLGHLVELGPAQLLANVLPKKLSYIIFGCIFSGSFLIYNIYRLVFQSDEEKARILSTMGIFISMCSIMFAFIEGK